ncbi:MAG: DUF4920 domain-containing protein [Bacteroidota bacterium]
MRHFNIFAATFLIVFVTSLHAQEEKTDRFYGQEFSLVKETESVTSLNKQLVTKDTIETQLTGKIKSVCQVKGCWMKVTLENEEEVFVRFKDYGFFVPIDSSDKEVTVNGIVFTSEMSIEDQKHYAKDRGASPTEIAKISKPKKQLRFEADGVLIRE